MQNSLTPSVTRRAASPEDLAFLLTLRTITMAPHHHNAGIDQTLEQHRARILDHYECAEIIEEHGEPVGLWKVARSPTEWHLMQVQLLPSRQGAGIGGSLIRLLLADARVASVSVRLNVLKANPARRLYERLGFRIVGETEHAFCMRASGSDSYPLSPGCRTRTGQAGR
jgi:ribosomal protein S18 acetylase RimI-like enzyme